MQRLIVDICLNVKFMMRNLLPLGVVMLIYGVAATVLDLINYKLRIMLWIDLWGDTAGFIIRGVLIVVGAVIVYFGTDFYKKEER